MFFEALFVSFLCLATYLVARLYARYAPEASPEPAFERWVASHPLVAALHCAPGREVDVCFAVRQLLGKGQLFNPDGGYPWQHYVVCYAARPLGEGVVGLFATEAIVGRVRQERPTVRALFEAVGRELADEVEEVWLHGRLKSPGVGTIADRQKMSWFGVFEEGGALSITAMIGQPRWLLRAA